MARIKINRTDYEKYVKEVFEKLGFQSRILSINNSGKQGGHDLGWDFFTNEYGSDLVKWHIEVKTDGLNAKNRPEISKKIYEKIFQSLTVTKQDFHCWAILLPFLSLDTNQRNEFESLNELFILPFKIVIWDKHFLEQNLQKISPEMHKFFYGESKHVDQFDISFFEREVQYESVDGLFKRKWFEHYNDIKIKSQKESSFTIQITPHSSNGKNYFLFKLITDKVQNFLIEEKLGSKLLRPNKKIEGRNAGGALQEVEIEVIYKDQLISTLKEAKNSEEHSLHEAMAELVAGETSFCLFSIETSQDIFSKSPFYEIDATDFNILDGKEVIFLHKGKNYPLKLLQTEKINKVIKENKFHEEKVFILSILEDIELRWYFVNKLPEKIHDLESLNFIWEKLVKDLHPFKLFKIFESNFTEDNSEYLIDFLRNNFDQFGENPRDELSQREFIELVTKIIDRYPKFIENAINFIKTVLEFRKGKYKEIDYKRDLERERDLLSGLIEKVYDSYPDKKKDEPIDLINKISKNFNLIADDGEYTHYTPTPIFNVLKKYAQLDFQNNFKKVVQIFIDQYKDSKWYGREWKGWELMGSGISRSGDKLVIADRHFVSQVLEPVLFDQYHKNPKDTWKYITDNLIKSEEDVDADHPDFLNRASLKVVIHVYADSNSDESYEILESFIQSKKGIPHKTEMVFQIVNDGRFNLTDDQKWRLVKAQLSFKPYNNLPANILIERIVGDLAKNGNKEASKAIVSWSENEDYVKRDVGGFMIAENSWKLLESKDTFDEGFKALTNHVKSKEFISGDRSDSWEIARVLTNALSIDFDKVTALLQSIFDKEKLSKTEQALVCYIPYKASNDTPDFAIKIFNDFIEPNFKELSIEQIEQKIPFADARENLASYAEKLAQNKHFKEALMLLEKLVNDTNPNVDGSNDENDPTGKFNLHKKVLEGEDVSSIETVRGWSVYGLNKFVTLGGQDYLDDVIDLVEKLSKDSNYYIRMQACIPLMDLARNRHTVLPGTTERFMSFDNALRVESIAIAMLANDENHKLFEVMRHLGRVFTNIRTLSSEQAVNTLTTFNNLDFSHLDLPPEKDAHAEVLKDMVPLFLFYAEFRKDAYKKSKIEQIVSKEYFNELNTFDDTEVKKLVKDILKEASDWVRNYFSWNLWKLAGDNTVNEEESFEIAIKYMNMVVSTYSHHAFESAYRFIEDHLDRKPNECLALWMKCLEKERKFLEKNFTMEKYHEMHWYPYFYNGKILLAVEDKLGKEEFLKWFKFLADYPKEVDVANDLLTAIDHLTTYTTHAEKVEAIFLKLIDRNASFYDAYEKWQSKSGS